MGRKTGVIIYVIATLLIIATAASQWLLWKGEITPSAANAASEGVPLSESALYRREARVEITVTDEYAQVLLNGEAAGRKITKRSSVLSVCAGDVCQIDARECENGTDVYIRYADETLSEPQTGTKLAVNGGVVVIFTARFAD